MNFWAALLHFVHFYHIRNVHIQHCSKKDVQNSQTGPGRDLFWVMVIKVLKK